MQAMSSSLLSLMHFGPFSAMNNAIISPSLKQMKSSNLVTMLVKIRSKSLSVESRHGSTAVPKLFRHSVAIVRLRQYLKRKSIQFEWQKKKKKMNWKYLFNSYLLKTVSSSPFGVAALISFCNCSTSIKLVTQSLNVSAAFTARVNASSLPEILAHLSLNAFFAPSIDTKSLVTLLIESKIFKFESKSVFSHESDPKNW